MVAQDPRVEQEEFGSTADGTPVRRYVLRNGPLTAALITRGAALQSLLAPDRDGHAADVVLGFADVDGYAGNGPGASYFGAVIGRTAGRIAGGRLPLRDREYVLARNEDPNNLHGGPDGFDTRVWDAEVIDVPGAAAVRFRLVSEDGDQGFPGRLAVRADYLIDAAGRLRLDLEATSLEPPDGLPSVVNLTNHAYFNLAGEGSGTVDGHLLRIPASHFTPIADLLPTGEIAPVAGRPLDFRTATPIGLRMNADDGQLHRTAGYDHNWVLDADADALADAPGLRLALEAHEPGSGRRLRVWSDQPGVQVFVANSFDSTLVGKSGRPYPRAAGFTAETQHFPDAPHHPDFPSVELPPGATFTTSTVFALDAC